MFDPPAPGPRTPLGHPAWERSQYGKKKSASSGAGWILAGVVAGVLLIVTLIALFVVIGSNAGKFSSSDPDLRTATRGPASKG
jgi:hypothetical protein